MSPGPDEDRPVSAQVILRDPEAAAATEEFFRSAGFETGPMVGTSFAISGSRADFDAAFGGAAAPSLAEADGPVSLPLDGLPPEVRASVDAIAVEGPPDFGTTAD